MIDIDELKLELQEVDEDIDEDRCNHNDHGDDFADKLDRRELLQERIDKIEADEASYEEDNIEASPTCDSEATKSKQLHVPVVFGETNS